MPGTTTLTLYEQCDRLRNSHPAAINGPSVPIAVFTDSCFQFYNFGWFPKGSRDHEGPAFELFAWHTDERAHIELDTADIPERFLTAIERGVPIPRERRLYGWRQGNIVTALFS